MLYRCLIYTRAQIWEDVVKHGKIMDHSGWSFVRGDRKVIGNHKHDLLPEDVKIVKSLGDLTEARCFAKIEPSGIEPSTNTDPNPSSTTPTKQATNQPTKSPTKTPITPTPGSGMNIYSNNPMALPWRM